jgi:hypothetical protein
MNEPLSKGEKYRRNYGIKSSFLLLVVLFCFCHPAFMVITVTDYWSNQYYYSNNSHMVVFKNFMKTVFLCSNFCQRHICPNEQQMKIWHHETETLLVNKQLIRRSIILCIYVIRWRMTVFKTAHHWNLFWTRWIQQASLHLSSTNPF